MRCLCVFVLLLGCQKDNLSGGGVQQEPDDRIASVEPLPSYNAAGSPRTSKRPERS